MPDFDLTRKCLGWHCDWRNKCALHDLEARNKTQYFIPRHVGEFCDHYTPKDKSWGEGSEPQT